MRIIEEKYGSEDAFAHKSVQEFRRKRANFADMEKFGGLSDDSKQKVSATKLEVIGECDDKLMEQARQRYDKKYAQYTGWYSLLWHIPRNSWVDEAMKYIYICTLEVRESIGEYTMTAMAPHLLIAIVAGNNVKTYPQFYLSTIANDIG